MLVPGPWRDPGPLVAALRARGVAAARSGGEPPAAGAILVDVVPSPPAGVFFSARTEGLALAIAAVRRCSHAALIECGWRLDERAEATLALGQALRDEGGAAVRMEASGAASPWPQWIECVASGLLERIYAQAVGLSSDDDGVFFTCGMHQFQLPDAEMAGADEGEASAWLNALARYQLFEKPTLRTGHTFRPHAAAAPRTLARVPEHRHRSSDGRHNPYGIWRILPAGRGEPLESEPLIVIVPSLVSVLLAAEANHGRALTRPEVEALVNASPAIAMHAVDAAVVERERGYADIDPGHAWEQWQVFRCLRD
jgi:hypothetical protein